MAPRIRPREPTQITPSKSRWANLGLVRWLEIPPNPFTEIGSRGVAGPPRYLAVAGGKDRRRYRRSRVLPGFIIEAMLRWGYPALVFLCAMSCAAAEVHYAADVAPPLAKR